MRTLRVAFNALPFARWGPLFHVLCLEHPSLRLEWRPVGFPVQGRSLLEGADVGLLVAPPRETGLSALELETDAMVVVMPVGHPLARGDGVKVADVVDEPFPGCPDLHPEWRACWTLDAQRGGPPRMTDDRVENADQGLAVVAGGRAIATASAQIADGLAHPGVVAVPVIGAPPVPTCLVWRSGADDPVIGSLIDLGRDMAREHHEEDARIDAELGTGHNGGEHPERG
jgi:DNA-binding transcriptional LysR family regulator